jgi:hypothetical protein
LRGEILLKRDPANTAPPIFASPHDMRIGGKILDEIDAAIRLRDKLLLVLSEHSIKSDWVETEVTAAFEEERARKQTMLFPIFSRAGGYLGGFVLGYNYQITPDFVLGVEADVAFPNYLNGATTISSPLIGQASYGEAVDFSGTVRARFGYAFGDWLVYGTGGFALTYDQVMRAQLVGTPVGGVAVPGTMEFSMLAPMARAFHFEDGHPLTPDGEAAVEQIARGAPLVRAWIILEAAQMIGYVVLTLGYSIEHGGRDGFIDDLYLIPEARGGGRGKKVLAFALAGC